MEVLSKHTLTTNCRLTDISEISEDIDEEITFSKDDELIAQQCLAIYKSEQDKDTYVGTGIIISNDGLFVSVGHNFKDDCIYRASYECKSYDIEAIKKCYDPEKCLDFFVGKLLNFNTKNLRISFAASNTLQIGDELRVCGYKSTFIGDRPIHTNIRITERLKVNQYCVGTQIISKEEWLDCQPSMYSPRKDCEIFKFIKIDTQRYKGLSGGPVYSNDGIHGLLIADLFLPSEYISIQITDLGLSMIEVERL